MLPYRSSSAVRTNSVQQPLPARTIRSTGATDRERRRLTNSLVRNCEVTKGHRLSRDEALSAWASMYRQLRIGMIRKNGDGSAPVESA